MPVLTQRLTILHLHLIDILGRTARRFLSYVGNTKLTDLPKPRQAAVDKACEEAAVRLFLSSGIVGIDELLQNPSITKAEINDI